MYIGKVNQIYNNRYHRAIRMKSIDVNSSTYFDFDVGNNDFDPEFIYKLYISWQLCDNIKVENTVDICNRKSYR